MSNSVSVSLSLPSAERFQLSLYDEYGLRKYLIPAERDAFLQAAESVQLEIGTFCATLLHTGCRISEALELTASRVDLGNGVVVIESLKKRRRGIFRAVPVPPAFLERLDRVHGIKAAHARPDRGVGIVLWDWSRPTGWRRVCEVMKLAEIAGLHATPKGLRHGFGIKAVISSVPLNMTQKWLGHAHIATTSIYTDAVGMEERRMAERMWA